MKKFTSYAFLLLFILSAYVSTAGTGPTKNGVNANIYTQTFGSGIPGTWQNLNNAAPPGVLWKYTTTGASNGSLPFANGTALKAPASIGDGYVIFDSDEAFPNDGDGILMTDAIDCSGKTNVRLKFYEYFAQFSTSTGEVEVSNDGTNWTTVHNAETGLAGDETTANPDSIDEDISLIADGQATVYVRFHYIGSGEYFWMVDDVVLYEATSALNVGITSIVAPVTTCNTLTASETITVRVKNSGTAAITDVPVYYVVDNQPQVLDTVRVSISGGASYDFSFAQTADLSVDRAYKIIAATTLSGDFNPADDVDSVGIHTGLHSITYSMNFDTLENFIGWDFIDVNTDNNTWGLDSSNYRSAPVCVSYSALSANPSDEWLISPCLNFNDATYSYRLSFYNRTFSGLTDAIIEVKLLSSQDPADSVQTLVHATLVNSTVYQQNTSFFAVPAGGTYYIGWHVTNATNFTSLFIDDITVDYYVKASNLAANVRDVVVYPNPNNGTFSIANLKSFTGITQVTVLDMMGRTVSEQTVNGLDKITMNVAGQAAGVYNVRISNDSQVLNKLITITK